MRTLVRLVLAYALIAATPALACTCNSPTVAEARDRSDVVFAGVVEAVHLVDSLTDWEPRLVVDFAVKRVWKGEVGDKFSLHTSLNASSCHGMWREHAKAGEVLLVYGFRQQGSRWKTGSAGASNAGSSTVRPEHRTTIDKKWLKSVDDDAIVYTTHICSRTTEVKMAVEDFDELGEFRELAPLSVMPDRELVESLRPQPNGLPDDCHALTDGKRWRVLPEPPAVAKMLIDLLESGPMYASVPIDKRPPYTEHWVSDESGRFGFCRVSQRESVVCGETTMVFTHQDDGSWKLSDGGVLTHLTSEKLVWLMAINPSVVEWDYCTSRCKGCSG